MNDVNLKKLGTLRLCGGGALVALATWGVWAFCNGGLTGANGVETAFDGWYYGREDQKTASAALAAAGLDEWSWDADGRLLVPKNKKNEYQTALAEAGAYPKAPSESRRDAIREMGAFESETKTRMRELDACAFQLEQTLERVGGIEYAIVGVRSRREQAGLTAKTVVTASIGVACREGCELDANLLSAITVAAKHQLGVDANENISIFDLKAGKSYFGSEKSVGNGVELALATEKERVETYWRDKLEKTFDYMGGARVSVVADLVAVDPDDVVETELRDDFADFDASFAADRPTNDGAFELAGALRGSESLKRLERSGNWGVLNGLSGWNGSSVLGDLAGLGGLNAGKNGARGRELQDGRATSAAERLAQVEVEKIEKPRPLATLGENARPLARTGGAFARLGNPVATRNAGPTPAPVPAQNLAEVGKTTGANGVLQVAATERRGGKRGVVSASYRATAENEGNAEGNAEGAENRKKAQLDGDGERDANAPVERLARIAEEEQVGKNGATATAELLARDGEEARLRSGDAKKEGKNGQNKKDGENAGKKGSRSAGERGENAKNGENVRFRVRALAVRIGTPRGYVRRVAQHLKAENAVETFAADGETNHWDGYYQTAEQKIVVETKKVALLLLRPLAERNGWSESELTRSVAVDVYADPDDFDALSAAAKGTNLENVRGDAGNNENGPFEVVANFGQVADVAEMVAEDVEETTALPNPEEGATERETDEAESPDFWTVWKERARRLDAKTAAGLGGVAFLAILAIVTPAARRRGRKRTKNANDVGKRNDENAKTAKNDDAAKRPNARKTRDNRDENGIESENKKAKRESRGKERSFDEGNAQNRENAQDGENERDEQEARASSNARRNDEARGERENGVGARDEAALDAPRNARDFQTAQFAQFAQFAQTGRAERRPDDASENAEYWTERRPLWGNDAPLRETVEKKNGAAFEKKGAITPTRELEDFDDFDDWDDLDDDLLEIRSIIERERARVDEDSASKRTVARRESSEPPRDASERTSRSSGDAARRREALEFIARNPEQAAESLRRWLRPGA